ncbi:Brachyurin [Frankliniella fusca]|uniref:Brachyurin n=1 Tax=Frankliniella fusca TaxID=407009 RepID=A0AAE1HFK9_9NEOP|nr:Brachyurin [Frankliniella fusca]
MRSTSEPISENAEDRLSSAVGRRGAESGSGRLRMNGGDVVDDENVYNFQVAIRPSRTQGGRQVELPVCSGVLIRGEQVNPTTSVLEDAYYVLTSATCALSGSTLDLFIGKNEVKATATPDVAALQSSTAIIHPEFLRTFTKADLAIIPIDATIGAAATATALLVSIDDTPSKYLASRVSMSGWGYPNDVFKAPAPRLRQISSRVVPNVVCKLAHLGKPITGEHLCTAGLINKGPCTGDSGAPLIVQSTVNFSRSLKVIGLATLTPNDGCSRGRPGIFTRLGSYLRWIQTVTNYDPERTR